MKFYKILAAAAVFWMASTVQPFWAEVLDEDEAVISVRAKKDTSFVEFSAKEIEECAPVNLADFLSRHGILVMNTGGTGAMANVSISGYAGACIKVFVDGVYANSPATGEFDWNQISIDDIETISIDFAPKEGQIEFAGASVSIVTKKSGGRHGEIHFESLSYENSANDTKFSGMNYSDSISNLFYRVTFSMVHAENRYELRSLKTNEGNENRALKGGLSLNYGTDDFSVMTDFKLTSNEYAADAVSIDEDFGVEKDKSSNALIKVKFSGSEITANHQFFKTEYDGDSTKIHTVSASYKFCFYGENFLKAGIKAEDSSSFEARRFQESFTAGFCLTPFDFLAIKPELTFLVWRGNNGLSGQHFIPSVKFIFDGGFTWSFYHSFVLPTFNQLYWNDAWAHGNTSLKNESGWGHCLSFRKDDFPFYASLQNSWYTDKIRWVGFDSDGMFCKNEGTGVYLTVILGSAYRWKALFYDVSGTYTHATLDNWGGSQIMWVPRWQANVNAGANFGKVAFSTSLNFMGKRYTTNENLSYYSPYFLLDAKVEWNMNECLTFFLKGGNLLDERYIYHDNFSAPSRSLSAGGKIRGFSKK